MDARTAIPAWLIVLAVLIGLTVLGVAALRPTVLDISDQTGPFYLTFSQADLDLDGDTDILVHNMRKPAEFEAWSGGAVWINQGGQQGGQAGKFIIQSSAIAGGWASSTGDLDGDGDADLLVYDGGQLWLGINQGKIQGGLAGLFDPTWSVSLPGMQVAEYGVLVAGDINGDSRADVMLLGRGQSSAPEDRSYSPNVSWTWLSNFNSTRHYSEVTAFITALNGLSVAGAALGDLDGDSDLDLLAVASLTQEKTMNGSNGLVLLNDGKGGYSDSGQRFPSVEGSSVALGDLDGDHDLDVLLGYRDGAQVLINQGGMQSGQPGRFSAADYKISGTQVRNAALADLNKDGFLDAVIVETREAVIYFNNEHGGFSQAARILPCTERQNLTIGDFNGDGSPDIFVAEYNYTAQVWLNDGKGGFSSTPQ